jgi:hypothetical protein
MQPVAKNWAHMWQKNPVDDPDPILERIIGWTAMSPDLNRIAVRGSFRLIGPWISTIQIIPAPPGATAMK